MTSKDSHEGTLHEWVARAAAARPDARAIVGEDGSLTYAELEAYANRLARVLRAHGCRRGDRVALLAPSSTRAVAALIGILKAGCAYVPLDATGAVDRSAGILGQCEPKVLLAGGCPAELAGELHARFDRMERRVEPAVLGWLGGGAAPADARFGPEDIAAERDVAPDVPVGPGDLAYLLFTSGTTGMPKGVPITHRNARAFVAWAVDYFGLGPEDRLSGHTALTFDLSTFDIYVTFAAGAELHLVPKRVRLLPHEVAGFIRERSLTLWFSVPSQLTYVARFDALNGVELPSLRHVAWCGDVLPTPSLLYWMRALPGVAFTNLYGPTETTVASSYYRVPEDFDDPLADIPIGRGCAGEELLVLDDDLRPVPPGAIGDIYIRGIGLSPGYWRDPERTRAAFLPDPLVPRGDGRIYRTGDRGRMDERGDVHFVGRADFQIKTGGYRVEPGEVENAVLTLEEVSACAVVPVSVDDFSGSVIGCAYVTRDGAPLRPGDAKKRLGDRLPGYMVPTRWMLLEELPVDSRGKIDRKGLRALMERGGAAAPAASATPSPIHT